MDRTYTQEVTRCPNCGATCLIGHDDDGQVCCAKCGNTFLPKKIVELSEADYTELVAKATERHSRMGWTAFTTVD